MQKFTGSGVFVTKWGSYGHGEGEFSVPYGVAVDKNGNVYVAEEGNNRIQKFKPVG
jgi:DNA-binding beta-propeller fold protein YncE